MGWLSNAMRTFFAFLALFALLACQPPPPQPVDTAVYSESLEQAQSQVSFDIPRAGWLPFHSAAPIAWRYPLADGATRVELVYAGEEDTVTIIAIDRPGVEVLQPEPGFDPQFVSLAGGRPALYLNNGTAQILQWTQGQISYAIIANGQPRYHIYLADELVQIADTLRRSSMR
jgi:hypothetical protein